MALLRWFCAALVMFASPVSAIEPFVIKDIRVEGIQRTDAGTVFSYLPVKVGDTMTDDKAAQAIRALFGAGFFKDVSIEADGDVLVVAVQERPSVAQLEFIVFHRDAFLALPASTTCTDSCPLSFSARGVQSFPWR